MGVVASGGVSPCRNPEASQVKCSTTEESVPEHSPSECVASRGLGMAALPDAGQYGHTGTPTPNAEGPNTWPTGEATRLCVRDRSCSATSTIRPTNLTRGLEAKVDEFSKELHLDPSLVPPPDTLLSSQTSSSVSSTSNQAAAGIGLSSFKSLIVNLTNRLAEVLQGRQTIETEGGGLQIRSTLGEQEFSGTGGGTGVPPILLAQGLSECVHHDVRDRGEPILNASVVPSEEVEHGGLATDEGQPLLRAHGCRIVPASTTSLAAGPIACTPINGEAKTPDPTCLGEVGDAMASVTASAAILLSGETVEPWTATATKLNEVASGTLESGFSESSTASPSEGTLETRRNHIKRTDTPSDQMELGVDLPQFWNRCHEQDIFKL